MIDPLAVRTWALAGLILASAVAPAWAAASYGAGSGLPNLSVTAIARDGDGLVWLGTEDGLVRFDGHRFIDVPLQAPGQRADTFVTALLASADGVYMATHQALYFQARDASVPRHILVAGADLPNIQSLTRAPDGSHYAATSNGQLWRWSGDANDAPVPLLPASTDGLPQFNAIHVGASGIWLASRQGVFRYDAAQTRLEPLRFAAAELDNGAREAQAVVEFPQGTLWIGYWNDALVRVDLASGRYHWYRPGDAASAALRSTSIYALAAQGDRLYIGSNRGLLVYRRDCDCMRGLNLPSWDAIDGSGIIAQSLLAEPDGVWAGVFGEGVVRFGRDDEAFHNQVMVSGRSDRLAHSMVRALRIGADRRLWIGTYGGGVQWVNAEQRVAGAPWALQSLAWDTPRIEARYLWSIEQTSSALRVGTGAGLFEQRDGRLTAVDPQVQSIRCTLETRDGRRYVGAQSGLYRQEADGLHAVALAAANSTAAIWSIAERGDELWLGSANGLLRLDRSEHLLAQYVAGQQATDLPGAVLTQRESPDGRYWLGTEGGLVEVIDGPQLRFVQPAALLNARVRNVNSIEFDAAGRFWLGTAQGLVRFEPGTGNLSRYAQTDGLFGNQFNRGASARDGGQLIFGGMGGLVAFDPQDLDEPPAQLRPQLTRMRVGKGEYLHRDHLDLPAGHDALQLEFASGEFVHPESVRYALRWRELGTTATELGDAASAVVERLPAGSHTLELQAMRVDDPASARTSVVLTVSVAPYWFETWWGRGGILALLLLSIAAYTQRRSHAAQALRARLEREVSARTRELHAATEALRRSNEQLQSMALIDPLTGLANRRQLFQQAQVWRAEGRHLSVMMIDLDRFKDCNDRYGHALGDRVLQEFSGLLRNAFAEQHLCARYGGEEFLCLCADANAATLEHAALALLHAVRAHRIALEDGHAFGFTISIGLAIATPGEPVETTIRRADRALYHAKHARDAHEWARD